MSPSPLLGRIQPTSAVGETEEREPALKKLRVREPRERNEMEGVTQPQAFREHPGGETEAQGTPGKGDQRGEPREELRDTGQSEMCRAGPRWRNERTGAPSKGGSGRNPERRLRRREGSASRQASGWSQLPVPASLLLGIPEAFVDRGPAELRGGGRERGWGPGMEGGPFGLEAALVKSWCAEPSGPGLGSCLPGGAGGGVRSGCPGLSAVRAAEVRTC